MTQPQQAQLKIELGDKEAEGIYANLAMIMHSPTEIVIDFARVMPRTPKARVLSRIVMTPMHAKIMSRALAENIKKFETQFGEIKIHGTQGKEAATMGFEASRNFQTGEEK